MLPEVEGVQVLALAIQNPVGILPYRAVRLLLQAATGVQVSEQEKKQVPIVVTL